MEPRRPKGMTELEGERRRLEVNGKQISGAQLIAGGIRSIADGLYHYLVAPLEAESTFLQDRIAWLEQQVEQDHEHDIKDLMAATQQVQMMEAQLEQIKASIDHLPDGVKEMVGFMLAMYENMLHQAKERQREVQQRVENPDQVVDAEFVDEDYRDHIEGAGL